MDKTRTIDIPSSLVIEERVLQHPDEMVFESLLRNEANGVRAEVMNVARAHRKRYFKQQEDLRYLDLPWYKKMFIRRKA